jgi:uncharacterized protein
VEFDGFEWDEGNWTKCQKHGVSIAEIEAVLRSPGFVVPDAKHSLHEQRLLAMGKTTEGRWAFVVFTLRRSEKALFLRPVSARYMHLKEARLYEEKISNIDDR